MKALVAAAVVAGVAACDQAASPRIAGLGGTTAASGGTTSNTNALAISPSRVQISVGATAQLSTNAPSALQGQIVWTSLSTSVAVVSSTGLVSGLSAGSAIIVASVASDTTRSATAVVDVVGTTTGGNP